MSGEFTPESVEALFTRADGYVFARWGRPIVPVVFGLDDDTLSIFKGAVEAVVATAGHKMAEHDPELGANLMVFFCRDWRELRDVPNLDRLIEGFDAIVDRLEDHQATQYRMFRVDAEGAIRACFVFLRIGPELAEVPAEVLALDQAVRIILLWADGAGQAGLLARDAEGEVLLRPEIAAVIRAAYDPVLPSASREAAHALRLFARLDLPQAEEEDEEDEDAPLHPKRRPGLTAAELADWQEEDEE